MKFFQTCLLLVAVSVAGVLATKDAENDSFSALSLPKEGIQQQLVDASAAENGAEEQPLWLRLLKQRELAKKKAAKAKKAAPKKPVKKAAPKKAAPKKKAVGGCGKCARKKAKLARQNCLKLCAAKKRCGRIRKIARRNACNARAVCSVKASRSKRRRRSKKLRKKFVRSCMPGQKCLEGCKKFKGKIKRVACVAACGDDQKVNPEPEVR